MEGELPPGLVDDLLLFLFLLCFPILGIYPENAIFDLNRDLFLFRSRDGCLNNNILF